VKKYNVQIWDSQVTWTQQPSQIKYHTHHKTCTWSITYIIKLINTKEHLSHEQIKKCYPINHFPKMTGKKISIALDPLNWSTHTQTPTSHNDIHYTQCLYSMDFTTLVSEYHPCLTQAITLTNWISTKHHSVFLKDWSLCYSGITWLV
jgi:hypothetical protein